MTDDLKKKGPADQTRININEPHEVRYWTGKFGCSAAQLTVAVHEVGVMTDKVEAWLKKHKK